MAQTAAHLADHVIPPVPVRQWVISVPKRMRGILADRPRAVAALTKIFLTEIERLLLAAPGGAPDAETSRASRPRLGGISFLHRFGSALNHHVHLHACVTDGVFVSAADHAGCDAPPTFLPARPFPPSDLASLTERVRRRVIRWLRLSRLLDAAAASDMLGWENSGFSVDASVRITLLDRDVPSYFQSLEHLLRYCARPPFVLERLPVIRGADGRVTRVRYVFPRHKAANWVGRGRGRKSTRPGATGVVELTPFECLDRLADLVPSPLGRPRKRPKRLAGDKGYSYHRVRDWLRTYGIKPLIPRKENEKLRYDGRSVFDKQAYKRRSIVEQTIGWLKECMRVGTRFEKLAINFLAMTKLAMIQRCLKMTFSDRA